MQARLNIAGRRVAIKDRQHGWLYDAETWANGFSGTKKYFQTPQGSTKTEIDTNIRQAGQLPSGTEFVAKYLRVVISPKAVLADVQELLSNLWLKLRVSNRTIIESVPVFFLPSGTGILGGQYTGTTPVAQATSFGSPDRTAITKLTIPVQITGLENLVVEVKTDTALTLTATTKVWIAFEGEVLNPL
jgi:hypothetical protein